MSKTLQAGPAPRLRVSVLGPLHVRRDGTDLSFPTRKTLALLVYLAVEGAPQPREKLAALCWPDLDAAHARQTLRTTLARLRQALGEAAGDPPLLQADGQRVALASQELWVDLAALDQAAAGPAALPALLAASALWRGEFAEGLGVPDAPELEEWVTLQRERTHRLQGRVLARLADAQAAAGQMAAAIATTERALALDRLDEATYRRLMQLHFAAGDRAAALQVYESCRAVLAAELGAAPVPETVALAARLRTTPPPRATRLAPDAPEAPPPAAVEPPLTGREAEHQALVGALAAARQGRAGLALLTGEAGIGKTRLAGEFLGWAAAQGADVLAGQAFEAGGRLPYGPWVQALRPRLERENAPDDLLADVWLTELSRLLPELRDRYPDLPALAGEDDVTAGTRLFEAVVRLGRALAGRAPLVLFFDDVQWTDAATRDLLVYAVRAWAAAGTPVLVLAAVRAEALAADSELRAWADDLLRAGAAFARLELGPLGAAAVHALVAALATADQAPAAAALGAWLFAETGGQPFFLVETLRTLVEQQALALRREPGGWRLLLDDTAQPARWGRIVPARLRELVRARLGRLDPAASALLTAAAVLGQDAGFATLCALANLDEDAALTALDTLLAGRLLRATPPSGRPADPQYAFSHDQIRDVVYTEAGPARRTVFHRRAYELLRARAAAPATLALHALRGGLPAGAFDAFLAAGEAALRVFAVRDAIAAYQEARQVLDEWPEGAEPGIPAAPQAALFMRLGRAYELNQEWDRARVAYEALRTLARRIAEPALERVALSRLAAVATLTLDLSAARTLNAEAAALAAATADSVGLAEAEWIQAQAAFFALDWTAALAHGERALARAQAAQTPELTARCLNVIAYAHMGRQDWTALVTAAEGARALYVALGERALEADCLCQLTAGHLHHGDTAAGLATGAAALAIVRAIANPWGLVNLTTQLVPGLLDAGRPEEALALAREGTAAGRAHGVHMLPSTLARLAAAERARGDLAAAQAALAEGRAESVRQAGRPFEAVLAAEACAAAAAAGTWDVAAAEARAALAPDVHALLYAGLTAWYEVAALARAGDLAAAEALIARLAGPAAAHPRIRVSLLAAQAALARVAEAPAQAATLQATARALAQDLGLPGLAAALTAI